MSPNLESIELMESQLTPKRHCPPRPAKKKNGGRRATQRKKLCMHVQAGLQSHPSTDDDSRAIDGRAAGLVCGRAFTAVCVCLSLSCR